MSRRLRLSHDKFERTLIRARTGARQGTRRALRAAEEALGRKDWWALITAACVIWAIESALEGNTFFRR